MKYAIVVDSACGLTKKEAEKLGWHYLPLFITIDNKEYEDGVQIDSTNLFDYFTLKTEVKTSAVSTGFAHELFEKMSKDYDKIFVYPISKYLSGTYQTLKSLEKDFPKLRVIESVEVAQLIFMDALWLDHMMKKDPTKYEEYLTFIENGGFTKSVTLFPKYNRYLVKGGRLHPAAAIVARMLKIVPLIKWEKGMLLKEGIGHIFSKSVSKCIANKATNFKVSKGNEFMPMILHANASTADIETYSNEYKSFVKESPILDFIPPVISIHTGPEAVCILAFDLPKWFKQVYQNTVENLKK